MKKAWSHIAIFFFGLSAGIITMYKIMGDQISIEIKKIKTKRKGMVINSTKYEVNIIDRIQRAIDRGEGIKIAIE